MADEVTRREHPRATLLSLRVDAAGRVILSAGRRVSRARAEAFLAANAAWIGRTRARMAELARRHPPFPYPGPAAKRALKRWGERALLARAAPLAARFAAMVRRPAPRVRLGEFRTQWGSCAHGGRPFDLAQGRPRALSRGRIALDWRLAFAPAELAEYVVAHEACHLAVPGHPPKFWATLERILPGARERRRALRELSRDLARW